MYTGDHRTVFTTSCDVYNAFEIKLRNDTRILVLAASAQVRTRRSRCCHEFNEIADSASVTRGMWPVTVLQLYAQAGRGLSRGLALLPSPALAVC